MESSNRVEFGVQYGHYPFNESYDDIEDRLRRNGSARNFYDWPPEILEVRHCTSHFCADCLCSGQPFKLTRVTSGFRLRILEPELGRRQGLGTHKQTKHKKIQQDIFSVKPAFLVVYVHLLVQRSETFVVHFSLGMFSPSFPGKRFQL